MWISEWWTTRKECQISSYTMIPWVRHSYAVKHCALSTECRVAADEHSPQAIILIPRNKLHHLLGSDADIGAIMALVVDDQKNHPSGVSVRVDMLELMTRILDSCKDKLAGFAILEGAWNLKDMSLYRRGIRHCTADGYIPNELPKLLATLVAVSPAPQVVDWNEWFGNPHFLVSSVHFPCVSFADIDISLTVSVTSWIAPVTFVASSPRSTTLRKHSMSNISKTDSGLG